MALARTNLSSNIVQSGATTITAASNAFTNGGLAVCIVGYQPDTGAGDDTTTHTSVANTGTGYTWTKRAGVITTGLPDFSCAITIWTAPITAGQTVDVTATFTTTTPAFKTINVYQYTGQHASPIGVTGTKNNIADNGADAVTLSGTPASTSEVIGGLMHTMTVGGSPLSVTPGTNHTELADVKIDGWCNTQIQVQNTGSPSSSFSWADVDTNNNGGTFTVGAAIEIIAAASGLSLTVPVGALTVAGVTQVLSRSPDVPTGLGGTGGNTQVSLSWTAPADNGGSALTDYIVQYRQHN